MKKSLSFLVFFVLIFTLIPFSEVKMNVAGSETNMGYGVFDALTEIANNTKATAPLYVGQYDIKNGPNWFVTYDKGINPSGVFDTNGVTKDNIYNGHDGLVIFNDGTVGDNLYDWGWGVSKVLEANMLSMFNTGIGIPTRQAYEYVATENGNATLYFNDLYTEGLNSQNRYSGVYMCLALIENDPTANIKYAIFKNGNKIWPIDSDYMQYSSNIQLSGEFMLNFDVNTNDKITLLYEQTAAAAYTTAVYVKPVIEFSKIVEPDSYIQINKNCEVVFQSEVTTEEELQQIKTGTEWYVTYDKGINTAGLFDTQGVTKDNVFNGHDSYVIFNDGTVGDNLYDWGWGVNTCQSPDILTMSNTGIGIPTRQGYQYKVSRTGTANLFFKDLNDVANNSQSTTCGNYLNVDMPLNDPTATVKFAIFKNNTKIWPTDASYMEYTNDTLLSGQFMLPIDVAENDTITVLFETNAANVYSINVYSHPIINYIVSQVVTKNGRTYVEYMGKPYLNYGVQIRLDNLQAISILELSKWKETLQKSKELNFNTVNLQVCWTWIEQVKDTYNFYELGLLLDWCEELDLNLQVIWFGSDVAGGPTDVPSYIKNDTVTYPRLAVHPTTHIDFSTPAFVEREQKAIGEMMKFIEKNDKTHRLVMVQVEAEPDNVQGYDFNWSDPVAVANNMWAGGQPDAAINMMDKLGQTIKASNNSVVTRAAFIDQSYINTILRDHDYIKKTFDTDGIDLVGIDNYDATISAHSTLYNYMNSIISTGNVPYTPEAGGNCSNTINQALFGFSQGGGHYIYEIRTGNFMPVDLDTGIYRRTPTWDWVERDGTLDVDVYPRMPYGTMKETKTSEVRAFNSMIYKVDMKLASLPICNIAVFNIENIEGEYISDVVNCGSYQIQYNSPTGGEAIAMSDLNGDLILMSLYNGGKFTISGKAISRNASIGYFDRNNIWVEESAITTSGNNVTLPAQSCMRIEANTTGIDLSSFNVKNAVENIGNVLTNIQTELTVSALKVLIAPEDGVSVIIKNAMGTDITNLNNSIIETGSSIEVLKDSETTIYKMVIYGDVNGDGNIAINDLVTMKQHLLKIKFLDDEFLYAGDIYKTGSISISAFVAMKKHLLNISTISQNISPITITLDNTETTIQHLSTTELIATIYPTNAENKSIIWASSDTEIASVSANGVVTGVSIGSATITATTIDGDKTAICTVTVIPIL